MESNHPSFSPDMFPVIVRSCQRWRISVASLAHEFSPKEFRCVGCQADKPCSVPSQVVRLRLVELGRIELPTSSMRTKRATNCAIAPNVDARGIEPPTNAV